MSITRLILRPTSSPIEQWIASPSGDHWDRMNDNRTYPMLDGLDGTDTIVTAFGGEGLVDEFGFDSPEGLSSVVEVRVWLRGANNDGNGDVRVRLRANGIWSDAQTIELKDIVEFTVADDVWRKASFVGYTPLELVSPAIEMTSVNLGTGLFAGIVIDTMYLEIVGRQAWQVEAQDQFRSGSEASHSFVPGAVESQVA